MSLRRMHTCAAPRLFALRWKFSALLVGNRYLPLKWQRPTLRPVPLSIFSREISHEVSQLYYYSKRFGVHAPNVYLFTSLLASIFISG